MSPDLLGEYNHMCTVLTIMERDGVHAAMYCNKRQMDLLTTADGLMSKVPCLVSEVPCLMSEVPCLMSEAPVL